MIETYFTSDTHFGHKNILEYEKEHRPFDTVEEMNEQIIANWNATVRPKDIIFHLGDFAFGAKNIAIAERLNGQKKLVLGNHDCYSLELYIAHFCKIFGAYHWNKCILTHIPVHPDNLGQRFFLNVHGHLHSKKVKINENYDLNYFNVAVEQHNLTPVHSSLIMERLKEIE
jgi:calcineurin-like phosphoesterase family protein